MKTERTQTNQEQENDLEQTISSATDCTGLIPAGITDEEELEHYYELYPYLPKADWFYFSTPSELSGTNMIFTV